MTTELQANQAPWIIGVDVGGTFTDFAARNVDTGASHIHKRPSTPDDPSRAILLGLEELKTKTGITSEGIQRLAHGTTVATNALLQRKGAKLAVVTTKGFRDLLEIGRQVRPKIYDLQEDAPPPLADRQNRLEIDERVNARGEIVTAIDQRALDRLVEALRARDGIESVAVCFLFSFLNPAHEKQVAAAIRTALPDVFVSVSSAVQPEFREFERFSTTTINGFLQPEVGRYMDRLRAAISSAAPNAKFGIFQSSGGLMSIDTAAAFPVRTALSGPAAGAVGAAAAGALSDVRNIITLDMGGTSTDVCLIRDGKTDIANARDIAGFRIRLPMVDVHTVGAGGGSIAYVAADGLLKVGPESAGAVPGPACYGNGGDKPTVSDANAVLGRLPVDLAGGGLTIDIQKAQSAVQGVADQLDMPVIRAALGITGIVASNMTRALRAVSSEKGFDPRDFTLMPFGGAGGLHAVDVARALGIQRIIVPHAPGILCAEGLIESDLQENFVATCRTALHGDLSTVAQALGTIASTAKDWVDREVEGSTHVTFNLTFDMRYIGQNYELPVLVSSADHVPDIPDTSVLKQAFLAEHLRSYGHADENAAIEIVNVRITALAPFSKIISELPRPDGTATPHAHQQVWFSEDAATETPLFDRAALPVGTKLFGPAIITQMDATTLVPPGVSLKVDAAQNLILEVKE